MLNNILGAGMDDFGSLFEQFLLPLELGATDLREWDLGAGFDKLTKRRLFQLFRG
jgi:hypothetical protein